LHLALHQLVFVVLELLVNFLEKVKKLQSDFSDNENQVNQFLLTNFLVRFLKLAFGSSFANHLSHFKVVLLLDFRKEIIRRPYFRALAYKGGKSFDQKLAKFLRVVSEDKGEVDNVLCNVKVIRIRTALIF
jgi:hypothetical protein